MKKIICLLLFLPTLSFSQNCQTPWEEVPAPIPQIKSCRLFVPHGWLVFNLTTDDVEIPNTLFYLDENHEWIIE